MTAGTTRSTTTTRRPLLDRQVDAVMAASRVLVGVIAASVAEVEDTVTPVQLRTLVLVATRRPHNLGALAEALGVHPSNATRACDRLVEAGLLTRTEQARDRRHLQLELTPDGASVVERVMEHRREALAAVMRRMPATDRRTLAAAMESFARAAGEVPQDGTWTTTGEDR